LGSKNRANKQKTGRKNRQEKQAEKTGGKNRQEKTGRKKQAGKNRQEKTGRKKTGLQASRFLPTWCRGSPYASAG
jgi:hypothetical protein